MSPTFIYAIALCLLLIVLCTSAVLMGVRLLDATARQPEMASTFLGQYGVAFAPVELLSMISVFFVIFMIWSSAA